MANPGAHVRPNRQRRARRTSTDVWRHAKYCTLSPPAVSKASARGQHSGEPVPAATADMWPAGVRSGRARTMARAIFRASPFFAWLMEPVGEHLFGVNLRHRFYPDLLQVLYKFNSGQVSLSDSAQKPMFMRVKPHSPNYFRIPPNLVTFVTHARRQWPRCIRSGEPGLA